jgi:DNA-binding Xre family transcriptional regulator
VNPLVCIHEHFHVVLDGFPICLETIGLQHGNKVADTDGISIFSKKGLQYAGLQSSLADNERKKISQYDRINCGIGKSLLERLRKNQNITAFSIETQCTVLDCTPIDVIRFVPDKNAAGMQVLLQSSGVLFLLLRLSLLFHGVVPVNTLIFFYSCR